MNKLLSLKNISKSYHSINDELKVIDDISFDIYEGDFISIIGPSGCGKSTILNIISSLDKDYHGNIIYYKDLTIGYMLQDDALFSWLNIYDNALLGLKVSKKYSNESILYVNNLLKKYGLYQFKNKYPSELSGGMKQRLALIRTLAINPDLLLLDEAFSALDYQTRISVSNDVFNIIKNENKTALLVTHDISEAISLSNKVLVLSKLPCIIKNTYDISFDSNLSIIEKRSTDYFSDLFNKMWKDIDINE